MSVFRVISFGQLGRACPSKRESTPTIAASAQALVRVHMISRSQAPWDDPLEPLGRDDSSPELPISRSWKVAFDFSCNDEVLPLQRLSTKVFGLNGAIRMSSALDPCFVELIDPSLIEEGPDEVSLMFRWCDVGSWLSLSGE